MTPSIEQKLIVYLLILWDEIEDGGGEILPAWYFWINPFISKIL